MAGKNTAGDKCRLAARKKFATFFRTPASGRATSVTPRRSSPALSRKQGSIRYPARFQQRTRFAPKLLVNSARFGQQSLPMFSNFLLQPSTGRPTTLLNEPEISETIMSPCSWMA